jgi:hypothetical protein
MKRFLRFWPVAFLLLVWFFLFRPFFTRGLLPIPADIIAGVYYPWLDYKWGFLVGVPVKNPLISDIPSLVYPWRSLAIDQFRLFRWPLWNPYYFGGMPLLANFQSAAFSYVNLLFLFLPKALAWSWGVALSPLLTMMALFWFLRHRKLGSIPSLLGAIIFSLSGFQIAWLEYNVHGHTALFLPLLLLFIDKILGDKRKIFLFVLPFLVAFQIFAGYLPIVIYSYVISAFYIFFFYLFPWLKKKSFDWKRLLLLAIFWFGGIAFSSVQLLPGFELAQSSIRKIDPTVAASQASYLPAINLVTALAPDFFGNPATGNYFGKAFYDNFYFFVGTATLVLIIFSLFFIKKNKNISFWWAMLLLSAVFVFRNPLGLILEKIFFLSGGVAARALFITDFSLALLAAWGLETILKASRERKKLFFSALSVLVFFGIAFRLSANLPGPVFRAVARRNLVVPFAVFFLSALCLSAMTIDKFKKLKLCFAFLFVLLTSSQLLYSAQKYLPFSKKELLFPTTPVLDFLLTQKNSVTEPFRVELGDVVPQNFLMQYGIETTSGSDALLPRQTGEFLTILKTGTIDNRISRVQLMDNFNSPLFPLLNTKYVLVKKVNERGLYSPDGQPPAAFLNPRFKMVFEDKTVQVYEDKNYLPRAFWVYDYQVSQNQEEFITMGLKTDFSKTVILESDLGIKFSGEATQSAVIWKEYFPGKIALEVDSDQAGLVFLANSYFPGWKARVDDRETTLLRANKSQMAVSVPAGWHQVVFNYQPAPFYQGLFISLSTIIIWAAMAGWEVFKGITDFMEKKFNQG